MGKYHRIDAPAGFDGHETRHTYYCKSKQEASDLRYRIKRWKLDRRSPVETVSLTTEDKNWIGYLRNRISDLGLIPAIIDHYERTAKRVTRPLLVADLCKEFIEYRATRPHNKRTLKELHYHVRAFSRHAGDSKAHEVTPADIRVFLDSAGSPTLARNHFRALSVLFKFAREQGVVVVNPLEEIRRPAGNRTEPGILTPDEFERLLRTADAKFPTLLPYVAIAGFAGLRSAELVGMYADEQTLQWSDMLLDRGMLVVRPEVAKTTRRDTDRRYPPIEPALAHWLEPYRQDTGPVVPYAESAFRRHMRALCVEAEVSPGHNLLRHSFASYWLARTVGAEGVGRLAVIMGNSEAVARRHYVESLAPGDGDRWFGLRRAAK